MSNSSSYSPTNIERPPFYRPPRNQQQLDYPWKADYSQRQNHQQVNFGYNQSQNQVPKPFGLSPIGSNSSIEQHYPTSNSLRAGVISQNQYNATPRYQPQPTSTVHKSLMNSNFNNQATNDNNNTLQYRNKSLADGNRKQWPDNQSLGQELGLPQSSMHMTPQQPVVNQSQHVHESIRPIQAGRLASPVRMDRDAHYKSSQSANHELLDSGMIVGHIPAFKTVVPNSKAHEFMWNRELERASITHQTYRTLPIVQPKPKARHDLATGNYMRLISDPTWNLHESRPPSVTAKDYEDKIQQAINSMRNQVGPNSRIVIPYNTPINLYSNKSINESSSRPLQNPNNDPDQPIFNYREYINSTRKA